jgi:hypothetical protein
LQELTKYIPEQISKQFHKNVARSATADYTWTEKRIRRMTNFKAQIDKIKQEINSLKVFVGAQKLAFKKILKKYLKWSGSTELADRFDGHVLHMPSSFTRLDLTPIMAHCDSVNTAVDEVIPKDAEGKPLASVPTDGSNSPTAESLTDGHTSAAGFESSTTLQTESTPASEQTRKLRQKRAKLHNYGAVSTKIDPNARYWNEYDDGDERPSEDPYTVDFADDDKSDFLGHWSSRTVLFIANIFHSRRGSTASNSGDEEAALLANHNWGNTPPEGLGDYAYATRSRVRQLRRRNKLSEHEMLEWQHQFYVRAVFASYIAAVLFLAVAVALVSTGRRKLKNPVDAFTLIGVIASLGFLAVGSFYSFRLRSRFAKVLCGAIFVACCTANGAVLTIIVNNTI